MARNYNGSKMKNKGCKDDRNTDRHAIKTTNLYIIIIFFTKKWHAGKQKYKKCDEAKNRNKPMVNEPRKQIDRF